MLNKYSFNTLFDLLLVNERFELIDASTLKKLFSELSLDRFIERSNPFSNIPDHYVSANYFSEKVNLSDSFKPSPGNGIWALIQVSVSLSIAENKDSVLTAKKLLEKIVDKVSGLDEYILFRDLIGLVSEHDDFTDETNMEYYGEDYCRNVQDKLNLELSEKLNYILSNGCPESLALKKTF